MLEETPGPKKGLETSGLKGYKNRYMLTETAAAGGRMLNENIPEIDKT